LCAASRRCLFQALIRSETVLEPTLPILALVAGAAVLAGAIAAVSGFGIGSLMTPLLLLWFPARLAVALVSIPHAIASVVRWLRLRRDVDRRVFVQFGIASVLGGLLGALLQATLRSDLLTAVLGVLMLIAGTSEILRRPVPLPQAPLARLGAGALSGFFGGLVGNQGGIRSAALLGFGLSPRQLVATSTASAVLVDLARVPVYLTVSGPALRTQLLLIGVASAGVVVGTFAGVPVLSRLPEAGYRRLIGVLLVLLGLGLLIAAA
jgi:uncharacterized membrane protein YfcA